MALLSRRTWPFVAGAVFGAAATATASWMSRARRGLDARLVRALTRGRRGAPVVVVPGLLGSQLLRADGTAAWLNLGNALGHHHLGLPRRLPFTESRDDLRPGPLVGTNAILPRAFGFTEYADLIELLESAGFTPGIDHLGLRYAVFSYDWRRDLVESARALGRALDAAADDRGDPDARFHLLGHSMGGLVVRYYLRYGGEEPREDAPVTWAGAHRVASALLVATPNAGAMPALGAILTGERLGLSYTTLAASVVARMPSMYELLPTPGTGVLLNPSGAPLDVDLHAPATWERFGWAPFGPSLDDRQSSERAYVKAALARARAFHAALARRPDRPCPVPVSLVGGDCLPTLARAIVGEGPAGSPPRFQPRTPAEQELMFEAGDGRVTRASLLAAHLDDARRPGATSGVPEVGQVYFGGADHHGLYADPAFQSLLLRLLVAPPASPVAAATAPRDGLEERAS